MTERIRVMQVLPSLVPGGAERMAAHLLMGLDSSLFEARLVSLYDPVESDLQDLLAAGGVPVSYMGKRSGFGPATFRRLYQEMRRFQPHVVHSHLNALLYAAPVARALGVPLHVYTAHNLIPLLIPASLFPFYKFCFKKWVKPVSIAAAVSVDLEQNLGLRALPMIPNGIPVAKYASPSVPRSEWRRREGFKNDEFLFACIARLTPQKNHALLLNALSKVPGARLLLAGDGELREALNDQARALGIAERVHFLGVRRDIPEVLAASDAFVLSSVAEANPLSVMEAMAAGIAVVCTSVGGLPELVDAGEHGFLVKSGDVTGFAHAMNRLTTDAESRMAMGERCQRRAFDSFDVSAMTRAYQQLYYDHLRAHPNAVAAPVREEFECRQL